MPRACSDLSRWKKARACQACTAAESAKGRELSMWRNRRTMKNVIGECGWRARANALALNWSAGGGDENVGGRSRRGGSLAAATQIGRAASTARCGKAAQAHSALPNVCGVGFAAPPKHTRTLAARQCNARFNQRRRQSVNAHWRTHCQTWRRATVVAAAAWQAPALSDAHADGASSSAAFESSCTAELATHLRPVS